MQHNLREFLRHGGSGRYVFTRQNGAVYGYRAGISIKSLFPGYADLRADFTDQLDRVIADNTRMLLNALTPPDTVSWVTEADLRDVSDAKEEALRQWNTRLTAIFEEYETHPQRLRPLRTAMEERLLRAFAGLVNQLRQQNFGIERYIWRSRDDAKVRDSHAEYDDQVFRWDAPPAGGHPGQAHNCRCFAEPIAPGSRNDVILAELALPAEAPVDAILRRLGLRAVAITALGTAALAALAASGALQEFTRLATERRLQRAAEILGIDPGTAEGLLAAMAHELVQEAVISGLGSSLPKSVEAAQIAGQAAALYEMLNPGTIVRVIEGDRASQLALGNFVQQAYSAFEEGQLRLQDGTIAQGWVEVFPELTEGERRLGELPGFTPERIEQWLETYPAQVLGLPNHTGSPPVEDPTGDIISTPIPDTSGPNIVTMENPHSIDNVSIPEDRARHILDGEGRSGGHRYGTGTPGKTEFPVSWSDDDILDAIRLVAGSGTVIGPAHREGDLLISGEVNGVTIRVVVRPKWGSANRVSSFRRRRHRESEARMTDKEAIKMLEKQIMALVAAGVDMSMDQEFFRVGEYDLALEGVYVAHKRHPGVLDAQEVRALVDDFGMDTAEFDR